MVKIINRRGLTFLGLSALPLLSKRGLGQFISDRSLKSEERVGFGWVRDRPDPSDRGLKAPSFQLNQPLPRRVDLTGSFPAPYNQGQLGSCTANAIAAAVQYARKLHGKPGDFIPSRLFIYYQERKRENKVYIDGGAQIRDGIWSVATLGCPPEDIWPYDSPAGDETTSVFPPGSRAMQEPPPDVMKEAEKYRTIAYAPLNQDQKYLESCIAKGYPFIFGFSVFSNFEYKTKVLVRPTANDRRTPFGHAVLVVGYDQTKRTFRVRNSWGQSANDGGYFDMAYDYVLDSKLSSDFWVVYQTLNFL